MLKQEQLQKKLFHQFELLPLLMDKKKKSNGLQFLFIYFFRKSVL